VELLRGMQQQGVLIQDEKGRWVEGKELDWKTLPARVEAMIGERIERLPENLREVLSIASVEGEVFTAEVLAHVQQSDEREIMRLLSRELDKQYHLVMAQGIQRAGAQRLSQYRFRHILFQKYLYNRLDDVERGLLHEDVGKSMERLYGEHKDDIAVHLARHFRDAGIADKAIEYLQKAANRAVQTSANEEAVSHFRNALVLLETLPERPKRLQLELSLQTPLAVARMNLKGYADPEVGEAFSRSHELCKQVGETPLIALALFGLWAFYFCKADFQLAIQLAEQILRLSPKAEDPTLLLLIGHNAQAANLSMMGEFSRALGHAEHAIAAYSYQRHGSSACLLGQNIKPASTSWASFDLWSLGYPDQGKQRLQDALAFARDLKHPFTLSFALFFAVRFHQFCRDPQAVNKAIDEELKLCTEFGFQQWIGIMSTYRGWVLSEQGQPREGTTQILNGIEALQQTGAIVFLPQIYAMLAEAYMKAEQAEKGLAALREGMSYIEKTEQSYYEAELHRLEGELLLMHGESDVDVEERFQQAIEVAHRQQARSLELRAAMSLARLWQNQGKRNEAHKILSDTYGWFTEGFDTPDLKDAKALLEELS
jgi:tetratricopeptide (TPR) repeat protein